jgi:hypothetical protein
MGQDMSGDVGNYSAVFNEMLKGALLIIHAKLRCRGRFPVSRVRKLGSG